MSYALVDAYEAALFDLDGVVYLGPRAVAGASEGLDLLRERGTRIGFVTNNAARSPDAVAGHLRELGVRADAADVVTSSQAAARLLSERLPEGASVFVVGTDALADEVAALGLTPVRRTDPQPDAVVQGYDPRLDFDLLSEAAIAIQNGALWVATNTDTTRPTDRGLVPGNGAGVMAVRLAVQVDPLVAGKPYPPLITETLRRLDVGRAIFVGDRVDTDISGGAASGLDTLLVLTGAHGPADVLSARGPERATHLGLDLRALLEPPATPSVSDDLLEARCGAARVRVDAGVLLAADGPGASPAEQLDTLRAAAALAWSRADAGLAVDTTALASGLDRLRPGAGGR